MLLGSLYLKSLVFFLVSVEHTCHAASQNCPIIPTVVAQDVFSEDNGVSAYMALSPSCGSGSRWAGTDQTNNVGFTLDYGDL